MIPQVHGHGGPGGRLPLPGALAGDGAPRIVEGDLQTIMAGSCLRRAQHHLLGHPAQPRLCLCLLSRLGERPGNADAGRPCEGDPVVISGESGAVGMGLLAALMETDAYQDLREALGWTASARC